MKSLKQTASVIVLAAASVFAGSAAATTYPEFPEGEPGDITVNNNTTVSNRNINNNNNNNTANGGNATSNATGGNANATGGSSNSGGNTISVDNSYDAPKPMGNVAATTIIPTGNCGEGWAMNVSVPFFGAGGGKTTQNKFCLSQEAAKAALNAGLVSKDTGMVATGLAGLRNLHPEFDAAANTVVSNLLKPCAAQAAKISAIVLTQSNLECTGEYVAGTENFAKSLQAAPVVVVAAQPAAPAQPLRVEVVNPVRVDGVVSTKEQPRPAAPVRRATPVTRRPAVLPTPAAPGCK